MFSIYYSNTKLTVKQILSCFVGIKFFTKHDKDKYFEWQVLVKISKLYLSNSLVKLEVCWSLTHLKSICRTLRIIYQKMWKTLVLTKTRNDLKRPERLTTSKKRPKTTYNEQETTWNDPQRVRHNLQWPEHNYSKQKKDVKRPTTSRFSDYFTIWAKRFSSLTRFPPNIWLHSFKHCFTENHGENRASSIFCHASSVNYHVYFLRDKRFIFPIWISCHQGKGEAIILAPFFHFHPFPKSFGLQHLHLFVDV